MFLLAAVLFVAVGCQKSTMQNEVEIPVEQETEQTITAYAPGKDAATTKLIFQEDANDIVHISWQVGDEISLFNTISTQNVATYRVNKVNDDGSASFTKVSGDILLPTTDYTAVYPSTSSTTLELRDAELRADQTQSVNDDKTFECKASCRMKSSSFRLGETMSFAHEKSMMTVTFNVRKDIRPKELKIVDGTQEYVVKLGHADEGFEANNITYIVNLMIDPNGDGASTRYVKAFVDETEINMKSTTTKFEVGKRYFFDTRSSFLTLDVIDPDYLPVSNVWTILDGGIPTEQEFVNLGIALDNAFHEENRRISLIFPNIEQFTDYAIDANYALVYIEATKATQIGVSAISQMSNLVTAKFPKVTVLEHSALALLSSLENLHIATENDCPIRSIHSQAFWATEITYGVKLITRRSNATAVNGNTWVVPNEAIGDTHSFLFKEILSLD